jgi:hypothetical protein
MLNVLTGQELYNATLEVLPVVNSRTPSFNGLCNWHSVVLIMLGNCPPLPAPAAVGEGLEELDV